ncbi:ricin-type beta-trefoil lectin domain protein [Streptosporangium canum]|uniref:ricin-type beta-trefoil lectin domain protein n=1 Tax=Streptosporangium canum TaxID=324952 RepID=UPI00368037CE
MPLRLPGLVMAALVAVTGAVLAAPAAHAVQNDVKPLPAALESVRRAEAVKLYGDEAIRPMDQRKTGLVSLGDSEISGEGAFDRSLYEQGTDGPDNWCHRSKKAAIHVTGIPADATFNLACSGGQTNDITIGGTHQYNELNQGDNLAIKARNTRIKMITVVVGANDSGGPEFGPTMTGCVEDRVLFRGNCWPRHSAGWAGRIDFIVPRVEKALRDIRQIMTEAGYATADYQLVAMSYPGPASPDVEDNPNFPGWYNGGCLGYLSDLAFARNKAVPIFEQGIRRAAGLAGARYLDASRLFHGREVCMDGPWVTGLHAVNGDLFNPRATQQSFHPNSAGHAAFGACLGRFYAADTTQATCMLPAGTLTPALYPGLPEFRQLRNGATGDCLDVDGNSTRNGRKLLGWACEGTRNQAFWYDPARKSLHTELSHDRCADIDGGRLTAGTAIQVWDCNGSAAQRWTHDGARLHAADAPALCATLAGGAPGARLTLAACDSGDSRQVLTWEAKKALTYTELRSGGKCLDVPGNSPASGANLVLYACDGNADQFWAHNPISGQLHNLADPGFCVDLEGGTVAAGQPIQVANCSSAVGQYSASMRWNLTGGTFLSRKDTGWAIAPSGTSDGSAIVLQRAAGQKWSAGAGRAPDPWKFLTADVY